MLEICKEMVANADNLHSYDFKQLLFALAFASKLLLFLISICFKQMLIFYSSGSNIEKGRGCHKENLNSLFIYLSIYLFIYFDFSSHYFCFHLILS